MSVSHLEQSVPPAVLAGFVAAVAQLPDPRRRRGVRHSLVSVLTVAAVAVLAGAKGFREMGDYAADLSQQSLARLQARWCARQGRRVPPSEPTLRRAVQGIDAGLFDDLVSAALTAAAWSTVADLAPAGVPAPADQTGADQTGADQTGADQTGADPAAHDPAGDPAAAKDMDLVGVSVDGKTMRGGWVDDAQVRLFAAMRHDGVVLRQLRVPTDTTEVTQIGAVLAGIDLTGVVVTADAAHANPRFARTVRAGHGDYVVTVKGDRPTLLEAIVTDLRAEDTVRYVHEEHTRGLHKRRTIRIAPAQHAGYHPGARQVFQVLRETFDPFGQRIAKDLAHGVTSLTPQRGGPADVAALVRNHWSIENKLHWVRDVTYAEDHHHTWRGNGPQVLATLRNLAISAVHLIGHTSVKRTLQHLARDQTRPLAILGL